ncbi:MAG: hypothetical protein ACYCZN_14935 [Candidatus Dormibacteria bacterium]
MPRVTQQEEASKKPARAGRDRGRLDDRRAVRQSGPAGGDDEQSGILVGIRVHRTIVSVLTQGLEPAGASRTMQILAAAREIAGELPPGARGRAFITDVASCAASYLLRFAPPPPWLFRGAEVALGGGRADLVFEHLPSGRWVVDEVKTEVERNGDVRHHDQVRRYLKGGTELWGDRFVGVRLCMISRPRSSYIYRPGRVRPLPLLPDWEDR